MIRLERLLKSQLFRLRLMGSIIRLMITYQKSLRSLSNRKNKSLILLSKVSCFRVLKVRLQKSLQMLWRLRLFKLVIQSSNRVRMDRSYLQFLVEFQNVLKYSIINNNQNSLRIISLEMSLENQHLCIMHLELQQLQLKKKLYVSLQTEILLMLQ